MNEGENKIFLFLPTKKKQPNIKGHFAAGGTNGGNGCGRSILLSKKPVVAIDSEKGGSPWG